MEGEFGLEVLPLEIINHIASFLGVDDIIACSGASSKMRQAFNDNLNWKRHCNIELVNNLKTSTSCTVPHFEWYDDELSNLSPVTKWKKNYMMQAHLFKNWRHGRFKRYELVYGPSNVVYSQAKVEFYGNDCLFLHTYIINENKLLDEIWDVAGTPFLHSTFSLNIDQFDDEVDCIHLYKIAKHKLVITYQNLTLVYDIALASFTRIPLLHAFIFDKSEKCSNTIITHDEKTFYKNTYFELTPNVQVVISDCYFVGALTSLRDLPYPVFHVWNFETGRKIEEVSVPSENMPLEGLQLLACDNQKDIIVKLRVVQDRYTYHCCGYDLSKMEFSSFCVKINYCDFQLFCNKYVIGAAAEKLFIYSYETSEKLLTKKCNQQILKKTLTVVGDLLLFGTFENIVYVIDLSTQDMINKVKLGFTLYSLRSICDKFVVINAVNSEVWEIGRTAKKLFKFPVDGSFAAVNQYCTKLAIEKENKIIILQFW